MIQIVLMGLGAGTAAAVLFASVASGSVVAMPLFYLAPLPILIVALGWSHWAALIAAVTAAACLAVEGVIVLIVFLLGVGLPAWWLGFLALLARPTPDGHEWYPVGRLVLWAACISALIVGATMLSLGPDLASLQDLLRGFLRIALDDVIRAQLDKPEDAARLIDRMVMIIPAAAAASTTITCVINLWLAARIVKISGRLRRPWPILSAMRLPGLAPAALGAAVAASFLPDLVGVSSSALAAGLMMAHVLLGLAVIHALTLGLNARGFILGALYAAIALFSWPISWPLLLVGLLGIADTLLDIRGLVAHWRGPPAAPT